MINKLLKTGIDASEEAYKKLSWWNPLKWWFLYLFLTFSFIWFVLTSTYASYIVIAVETVK